MIASGIIKILVLAMIGAILFDVLTHPAGTRALADSLSNLLGTAGSLAATGGRTNPGRATRKGR